MIATYKFKMKPTSSQKEFFSWCSGCARFVYNHALKEKMGAYSSEKKIRPSEEPEYVFDIVRVLKKLGTTEKTSGNHRIDSCEYEFVTALNFNAKILQFFENQNNIKDFNKSNDVAISFPVGIPQEIVPDVIVREKEAPENQRPRGRVEGFSGTSIPTLLPSTLNAIAKVVNNFKNPIMPRDVNGVAFQGSDTHYLFCRMATTPQVNERVEGREAGCRDSRPRGQVFRREEGLQPATGEVPRP